ncbi:MAG: hypothetical protein PVI30_11330 [Myxococcales bacterium]|jgi:hypothetical protein
MSDLDHTNATVKKAIPLPDGSEIPAGERVTVAEDEVHGFRVHWPGGDTPSVVVTDPAHFDLDADAASDADRAPA